MTQTILEYAKSLFGIRSPPPPVSPFTSRKRKSTRHRGRPSKLQKLSVDRIAEVYTSESEFDSPDFYEGHARRSFHRATSLDHGLVRDQRLSYYAPSTKSQTDRRSVLVDEEQAQRKNIRTGPSKAARTKVAPPRVSSSAVSESTNLHDPIARIVPRIPAASPKKTSTAAPEQSKTTGEREWTDQPNTRARKILEDVGGNKQKAAKVIRKDLKKHVPGQDEAEYVFRDAEIRDGLWQVMDRMERFARKYFDFKFEKDAKNLRLLKDAFGEINPETVKVIGRVASGGPSGQDGWRDLFFDSQKRRALVCAIIGNVLVEQVYQHPLFGGTSDDDAEMFNIQEQHQDDDGFNRAAKYAEYISDALNSTGSFASQSSIQLPLGFDAHAKAIVAALDTHLKPLDLDPDPSDDTKDYFQQLYNLVTAAGILSLLMRIDPHTVYYFTPVFKEDSFERQYMECFNRIKMEKEHPRQRTTWPEDYTESDIARAKSDEPLTQIVIMDGVTAYRPGGWEARDSKLWDVKYLEGEKGREKGVRSRIIAHGWVYCRWGRPRHFGDGRPNDDPKMHGRQWKGGFVEFTDVDGVPKDVGEKKKGVVKGKGKSKTS